MACRGFSHPVMNRNGSLQESFSQLRATSPHLSGSVHLQMAKADQRFGQRDGSDQNFDYMFKLLIIGNSSVGKTSFLFRYADDSFSNSFVSTVGIDFKVKTVYRNDKRVKLQIWVSSLGSYVHVFICGYPFVGVYKFILLPSIPICTVHPSLRKLYFCPAQKITIPCEFTLFQ